MDHEARATCILPINKAVRTAEGLTPGSAMEVRLRPVEA